MPCVTSVYETQYKAHCVLCRVLQMVARRSYIFTASGDLCGCWIKRFHNTAPRSRPRKDRMRLRHLSSFLEYEEKGKENKFSGCFCTFLQSYLIENTKYNNYKVNSVIAFHENFPWKLRHYRLDEISNALRYKEVASMVIISMEF
jgi:hypothetical protein